MNGVSFGHVVHARKDEEEGPDAGGWFKCQAITNNNEKGVKSKQ